VSLFQYRCIRDDTLFYYQYGGRIAPGLIAYCPVCGTRSADPTGRTFAGLDEGAETPPRVGGGGAKGRTSRASAKRRTPAKKSTTRSASYRFDEDPRSDSTMTQILAARFDDQGMSFGDRAIRSIGLLDVGKTCDLDQGPSGVVKVRRLR
jgi:hypothetical protein